MINTLTSEDIRNLTILVNKAPVTGAEATTVALLLQKLANMNTPEVAPAEVKTEAKPEEKKK